MTESYLEECKKELDLLFDFAQKNSIKKCAYGVNIDRIDFSGSSELGEHAIPNFVLKLFHYTKGKYINQNLEHDEDHIFISFRNEKPKTVNFLEACKKEMLELFKIVEKSLIRRCAYGIPGYYLEEIKKQENSDDILDKLNCDLYEIAQKEYGKENVDMGGNYIYLNRYE